MVLNAWLALLIGIGVGGIAGFINGLPDYA